MWQSYFFPFIIFLICYLAIPTAKKETSLFSTNRCSMSDPSEVPANESTRIVPLFVKDLWRLNLLLLKLFLSCHCDSPTAPGPLCRVSPPEWRMLLWRESRGKHGHGSCSSAAVICWHFWINPNVSLFMLQCQSHETTDNCFNSLILSNKCKMEIKTHPSTPRVLHCENYFNMQWKVLSLC